MWTSWPGLLLRSRRRRPRLRLLVSLLFARCISSNRWLKLSLLRVEIVEGTVGESGEKRRDWDERVVREAL